ncbi:tRNA uridine-5-carboxymethylaminomethyl(34) synthesis GTPase MnmE [Qipengyuania sp. 1XM1-15A]|uniref:tRNA uridine-5-carboxymethylaminomethyl(34) synthesis GTPase MnmE n=1 Tax=Qipengyuania xiamenensis TaxID=2867237 RepID=UPI001C86CF9E|nr:tRNA uridine-5-carboxymethylaminomethyl(34) synthesis GTPase MnmE [Qipengyuania xiamenensis]MBX7533960.1 tRNA uridine-5-carboxymethylaminomethyl(34) synthesis GTPase MnmE [Qipengyuania xiamenensis]
MDDTIFALSSGAPPAAIGVVRISGPKAGDAVTALAGSIPKPRRASLRNLRDSDGAELDSALVIWFPGPKTSTGEDLAEFHCHGGRAVVLAIENALASIDGLRRAEPGEFTRRAFANGVIDLAEAEGLGDLLAAETDLQRQAAQASAGGGLSRKVEGWRDRVLYLSALVEAVLDFGDEDDVESLPEMFHVELSALVGEWREAIEAPRAERLRDGIRIVFAGPPNTGKSSLFNALLDEGAAIVSEEAGTTRDVIERPVAFAGVPFILIDTAGLRDEGAGAVEQIGIGRARQELERADIVLWLGEEGEGPSGAWEIASRSDVDGQGKNQPRHVVSAVTGDGLRELLEDIVATGRSLLPKPGLAALNQRQGAALADALAAIEAIGRDDDPLLTGEKLRLARLALDRLLGRHSTEDMLDALFGRFCIGK